MVQVVLLLAGSVASAISMLTLGITRKRERAFRVALAVI